MNAIENSFSKLVNALKDDMANNDVKNLQPFIRKLDGLIEDLSMTVIEKLNSSKESLDDKVDDEPASTLIVKHIMRSPVGDLSGVALEVYGLILLRDRLLNEYELAKGLKSGKD